MGFYFEKLIQYFELKRVGGTPKGYPFSPLILEVLSLHFYYGTSNF